MFAYIHPTVTSQVKDIAPGAQRFLTVLLEKIHHEKTLGRKPLAVNVTVEEYAAAHNLPPNVNAYAMLVNDVDSLLSQVLKCDNRIFDTTTPKYKGKETIRLFKVISAYIYDCNYVSVRMSPELNHLIDTTPLAKAPKLTRPNKAMTF